MSDKFSPSPERIQRFRKNALKEYYDNSVVKTNLQWRPALPNEEGRFVRIGWRFLSDGKPFVDEYSKGEQYFSPEIFGLGRSVAIGEEAYLVKQLQRFLTTSECPSLIEMFKKLASFEVAPALSVAFMPLEYFNDFAFLQLQKGSFDGWHYMPVGSHQLRIYWSSRHVKFKKFMFLSRDAIEWVVKLDEGTGEWLKADVTPEKSGKFEVNVETTALCRLVDKTHGLAFVLNEKPIRPLEVER